MTSQTISGISDDALTHRLKTEGIVLEAFPFVFRIKSPLAIVREGLQAVYADYPVLPVDSTFVDFHVAVVSARRVPRPLCVFEVDGARPFTPLAAGEAFAFLEWGMNWCVTGYCHSFLTIHSAVLERAGRVLIMPAPPGSGKSTLCAALVLSGWRLLSDEMALLDTRTGLVVPSPRPISLKNKSIDIIRGRAPEAHFGPIAYDTMKGTVAHMRVPADSLARAREAALPAWVVFPQYKAEADASLALRSKATSLVQLADNSFNQTVMGRAGFEALARLIDSSDCYDFTYGRLDEAIEVFSNLPIPR